MQSRRFPRGKRGLKLFGTLSIGDESWCRFPRGKRGLKFRFLLCLPGLFGSLPSREAWIEISPSSLLLSPPWSLPSREAWIEMATLCGSGGKIPSLPSREAWIEILVCIKVSKITESLPSREAWIEIIPSGTPTPRRCRFPRGKRGLKSKETADSSLRSWSLPSREAWIEIRRSRWR